MSSNGGRRRRKDTRDFPTVPSLGSKRPGRISPRGEKKHTQPAITPDTDLQSTPTESPAVRESWRFRDLRPTRADIFPAGSWRALWLGFQSWLVFWAFLVMLAVVSWLPTGQMPSMQGTTWKDALAVGNGVFAMSFGAMFHASGLQFSLVPWGLTCFVGLLLAVSLKAAKPATPWALLWGILAFAIPSVPCLTMARLWLQVWPTSLIFPGFLLVVFLVVGRRLPWWNLGMVFSRGKSWSWFLLAGRLVRALSLMTLLISGIGVITGLVIGWKDLARIWSSLNPGALGSVVLVLGLLAYLPTLLVWAASWLSGPGFTVGTGTIFSPGQVISGDLPPVPFLAGLPQVALGWWPIAIPVIAGIVTGLLMSRRHEEPFVDTLLSLAMTLAVLLGGGFVIITATTGAIGQGRLANVGPSTATLYAGVIAWGIPYVAALLLGHRQVSQAATRFSYKISGKNADNLPTTQLEM